MVAAVGGGGRRLRPVEHHEARAEMRAQRLGAGAGAAGDAHLGRAFGEERRDDGAGAAAGAEHQRRARRRPASRGACWRRLAMKP